MHNFWFMTHLKRTYKHYICVAITLGFLACTLFLFSNAIGRAIESGRDLGLSIAFYFCELFHIPHTITPTVNALPSPIFPAPGGSPGGVPSVPPSVLPDSFDGFTAKLRAYGAALISSQNALHYLSWLSFALFIVCQVLLLIIPIVVIVYVLLKRYMKKENNDYNRDSVAVKALKKFSKRFYRPVKNWVLQFINFVKTYRAYWIIWLCVWLFNFNVFTVALEFFAYYFYFVVSFDIASIYRQVYKLFFDLSVPVRFIPVWVWVIIGFVALDCFRKKIAYARLNHMEMRNRGFINARPIVAMVCGTMGKKKTTAITDMALSQEVMFRDKAFQKLLENDLKFPFFPWINLENSLKRAMSRHSVYNLATVKRFIKSKRRKFEKRPIPYRCFGYDFNRYGYFYDDKLKVVDLWEVLEIYAQLYFIYIIESSLIISNYSIRTDNLITDLGNFPRWHSDFFRQDSRLIDSYSRHAHIIDFDALRLGRKLVADSTTANSFEFGVIMLTEVGKERKNTLELREVKKTEGGTNQKNDGFNDWLKMVRHSATVDNFPFVRVIADEQRPESWGADARDLCEIVHIRDSGETCLAMPFFALGELLYGWLYDKFARMYYQYRYVRSDNTLPVYLLKLFTAKMHHYYTGIYNRFGYCTLRVQVESGTQDGQLDENRYFLMFKKIYSKRFSTDCFSDYFTQKALRSPVGIDDLREYETEKASFEELETQNSYFINDLINRENDNE